MQVQVVTLPVDQLQALISQAVEQGVDSALSKVESYSNDKFITAEEAAELLGCNSQTLLNRRKKGQYKNVKKVGSSYLFSLKELDPGGKLS
jgi:1-aminocyclopropane-1-carboxylate deaminase/D-cysteine desulfhydrase-like pyridoxal-dependent ACC family enzyme